MSIKKIAIVGSGIAGLGAAYILSQKYEVDIFEANPKLGGHTNTITTPDGTAIDTGFIVFNTINYPNFCKLLQKLNVASAASNMSFGYHQPLTNNYYASDVPSGLFYTKRNLVSPKFYRMIADIIKFNRIGRTQAHTIPPSLSMGDFLTQHRFSLALIHDYVLPMGAAIWSASVSDMQQFPAKAFLSFWNNHHLLQIRNRPQWQTISGGAQTYIDAITQHATFKTSLSTPVYAIDRHPDNVTIHTHNNSHTFDAVVLATHADQAFKMLSHPSKTETELLGSWSYSKNNATLHTDTSIAPKRRNAWASWMVHKLDHNHATSYYMNRLQPLATTTPWLVSIEADSATNTLAIDNKKTCFKTVYEHPIMNASAMNTQSKLSSLQGQQRTFFCGSYFGYGFHEDAFASAVLVGKELGCDF
jgi:uncharacterized protein